MAELSWRSSLVLVACFTACAHALDSASGADADRITAPAVTLEGIVDDTVDPEEGDATDWRSFDLDRPGTVSVEVHWDREQASLGLWVYDALGRELARGEPAGPRGVKAQISAEEKGRYYVMVRGAEGSPKTAYSLRIQFRRTAAKRCNDCTPGQQTCVGKDGYAICEATKEGCNAWVQVLSCQADQTCREGQCLAGCQDQCRAEERRCSGASAVQVCSKSPTGCMVFGDAVLCDSGFVCDKGRCKRAEPKPEPRVEKKEPEARTIIGEIISVYSEAGQRMLHIKVGEQNQVRAGMLGSVIDPSGKPVPEGDVRVLGVSGAYVKASTKLDSLGNNRRVQIVIR